MRLLTADSIVLAVTDLHDRDRIVSFLTAEHGRRRGVARGARTRHSRFGSYLQPLSRSRITWFEKEGRELVRIREVSLERPARHLHEDLEGLLLGSYLAEHIEHFAQEDEDTSLLFRLLDSTLLALEAGVDRDLAARYFEAWVLRLTGIFPSPVECPACGASLEAGAVLPHEGEGIVCPRCGGAGLSIGPEVVGFLRRIGRENLSGLSAAPPGPGILGRVEELCGRVRRSFLQQELRSYGVMRDTLAALPCAGGGGVEPKRRETDE